jgi:hypothetical protein
MKNIILCTLTIFFAGSAAADDFLPLEEGNFWNYVSEGGTTEMQVVGEQVPLFQGNPFPIFYSGNAGNEGLVNFWTSEADGGVLLWGFERPWLGLLYQPPIRVVDAPLYVGKTWTETFDIYALPDTIFTQTAEITFRVAEDPELTLPAGVFPTFGIEDVGPGLEVLLAGRYTLTGKIKTNASRAVSEWYSLGVGVVQMDYSELFQLETWTDHPVTSEGSTWGGVKALYRGTD